MMIRESGLKRQPIAAKRCDSGTPVSKADDSSRVVEMTDRL